MLSYWPSLGLLAVFLVIVLECRAIGARVTLPLGSFLVLFCYGCIGAPLLAILVQQFPALGGFDPASMAWLTGPPLEELAKAVPVIVLAFLTRESRRLSIADLTLAGFASGAGFGFVEANLKMIVDGVLPDLHYFLAFGLQVAPSSAAEGSVFFAGHAVTTGLVGLAAGIGLHILQLHRAYVWLPSTLIIAWASFDHGVYNWKVLHADGSGIFPQAHSFVELLHRATLHGRLATWVLAFGLIAAQIVESYLCAKAVGRRRDLLLALEWRPWVINEWLIALIRVPFGRGALARTLAYFRLRRAFFLAALHAKRDVNDVTMIRHARSLEDRLKRERALLFDPPSGTWFLPLPVLTQSAVQWAWHMRWVLLFAALLFLLFMLDPATLPGWLRQLLFGDTFTNIVLIGGLAFAVWKVIQFARSAAPDPLAAEGAAFANYYTRELLLGCSLLCGLFPTLALMFGWTAVAPGAAFLSGYLPGWIGQGGNLQTLLGLGAFGGAVTPDPRPPGDALRHEIAAGDERIRRLQSGIDDTANVARHEPSGVLNLDGFLDAMARLDAERDVQSRRLLALAEFQRQAADSLAKDPAPSVDAVKNEFDLLASELLEAAAKELDAIAAFEQAYANAWSEIMQNLDAHDAIRRRLRGSLLQLWHADASWALRLVERTDECLLPVQLALLPELQALVGAIPTGGANTIAAGVERILRAASTDVSAFATPGEEADAPAAFDLRTTEPSEAPAPEEGTPEAGVDLESQETDAESPEPERERTADARGEGYQEAVDRFMDAMRGDTGYLETIKRLEQSHESLRQPAEPASQPIEEAERPAEEAPAESGLDDIIDAIKRDSGYLDLVKKPAAANTAHGPAETAGAPAPRVHEPFEVQKSHVEEPEAEAFAEATVVATTPDEPEQSVIDAAPQTDETSPLAEAAVEQPPGDAETLPDEPEQSVIDAAPQTDETSPAAEAAVEQPPGDAETLPDELEQSVIDAAPQTDETSPAAEAAVEQPPGVAETFADEQQSPPLDEDGSPPAAATDAAQAIRPEPEITAVAEGSGSASEEPAPAAPTLAPPSDPTPPAPRKSAPLFRLPEAEAPAHDEKPPTRVKKWFGGVSLDSTDRRSPSKRDDKPVEPFEPFKGDGEEKPQVAQPSADLQNVAPSTERQAHTPPSESAPVASETPAPTPVIGEPVEPPAKAKDKAADASPTEAVRTALRPTITVVSRARPTKPIEQRAPDTNPAETAPAATDAKSPTLYLAESARPGETPKSEAPETTASESAPASLQQAPHSAPPDVHPKSPEIAPNQAATKTERAGADDAPSSADRLTDLLAKLEKAMQAKTADEAVPPAKDHGPRTVGEPAEPPSAPVQAPAAPIVPTSATDSAPAESKESEQLAPERLSFLLTKLFEAVKRESVEQGKPAPVEDREPLPVESAANEILDLRITGPSSTAEPSSAPSSDQQLLDLSVDAAAAAASEIAGQAAAADAPQSPAYATGAPTAADARPVEIPEEARSAEPPQPAELPQAAPAPQAQAESSVPPSQARPRAKPAAPAGTFGTRRKPPPTLQNLLADAKTQRPPAAPPETTPPATAKRDRKPESAAPASHSAPQAATNSEAASKEQPNEANPTRVHSKAELAAPKHERAREQSQERAAAAPPPGAQSETTFRAKGASGVLTAVESLPGGASAEKMPAKYYGPKHVEGGDDGAVAKAAQQRASNLAEALAAYYTRTGEPQPPMHTTDRATLQRAIAIQKLEAPRRRGAPWSLSGMARRGEAVIRLKPGAEKYVEFVPSKESFGQVPHFYQRGVGKGSFVTYVPAAHLEYFDANDGVWVTLERGRQ